jgi:hypothetical protein
MKRIYFACLFLCLTTTSLLSQSNLIPAPISASQADPKAQAKILDSYGKSLSFEASLSAGTLFMPVQIYDSGVFQANSVAVADLNGDGKPDLVMTGCAAACAQGIVSVLLGNGDGTFQLFQTYISGIGAAFSVSVADLNGDGKPDLIVGNGNGNNTISVFLAARGVSLDS